MKRIDCKQLATSTKESVAERAAALAQRGITPKLTVFLVGDDPASRTYAAGKTRDCAECKITSEVLRLPDSTPENVLLREIERCNQDPAVSGILVQLPLPAQISTKKVLETIHPDKDVDGFTPINIGRMMVNEECFLPCTPAGCIEILRATGVPLRGKHAVMVGRSNIVGKPMAVLLLREDATVTVCHSKTAGLAQITRNADLLIVAIGCDRFITGDMIKPGAIVIDVGINCDDDGKLHGDVDEASCQDVEGSITPVPGGVGLVTRAMLMVNTLRACELQHGRNFKEF